jgi:hypothetical protein
MLQPKFNKKIYDIFGFVDFLRNTFSQLAQHSLGKAVLRQSTSVKIQKFLIYLPVKTLQSPYTYYGQIPEILRIKASGT